MGDKVLVTGSSGFIGRQISPFLEEHGFVVRGFDKIPCVQNISEFIVGDIEDLDSIRVAVRGVDIVIHLAAHSDDGDFKRELLGPNVVGVYNVLEALRLEQVNRLVLASSIQAIDIYHIPDFVSPEDRGPISNYGLLKILAEDMCNMYSRVHGLSVIAAQLGWVLKNQQELEEMQATPQWEKLFLSRADMRSFFLQCVLASTPSVAVLHALSRQLDGDVFDMASSYEVLGFKPTDILSPETASIEFEDES